MDAMTSATLLGFAATCLVIELTPGPNMAYLAVLSADRGRRAGLAATFGIALGLLAVGLAAALGLAAAVSSSRLLYEGLRWAGTLYLLYLAWEAWRGEDDGTPEQADPSLQDARYFARGLVTNLLNPKAALFYVAVLPTFLDDTQPLASQAVTLSLVYVAIATAVHTSIVLLADRARGWLLDERRSSSVRRAMAVLLAAIALWLFATTRQAG